jgi:hypothetical protein
MDFSLESSPTPARRVQEGSPGPAVGSTTGIRSQQGGQPIDPALASLRRRQVQSPSGVPTSRPLPDQILAHSVGAAAETRTSSPQSAASDTASTSQTQTSPVAAARARAAAQLAALHKVPRRKKYLSIDPPEDKQQHSVTGPSSLTGRGSRTAARPIVANTNAQRLR